MAPHKNRLYVALYPSGVLNNEERKYHWALIIGPKNETPSPEDPTPKAPGTRFHVKNRPDGGWYFEELPLEDVRQTNMLLARILVAKIEDDARLIALLRRQPVIQNDRNWMCMTWVREALVAIMRDANCVGRSKLEWPRIEKTARRYVAGKTKMGWYRDEKKAKLPKPTFDLLRNREVIT